MSTVCVVALPHRLSRWRQSRQAMDLTLPTDLQRGPRPSASSLRGSGQPNDGLGDFEAAAARQRTAVEQYALLKLSGIVGKYLGKRAREWTKALDVDRQERSFRWMSPVLRASCSTSYHLLSSSSHNPQSLESKRSRSASRNERFSTGQSCKMRSTDYTQTTDPSDRSCYVLAATSQPRKTRTEGFTWTIRRQAHIPCSLHWATGPMEASWRSPLWV